MFVFLIYLALTLVSMFAAKKSGQDDLKDLSGILFMSWMATNIIWTIFPDKIIPLMPIFHFVMLCACIYFSRNYASKWSAWVAAGFVAMFVNHATGTPGQYAYHLTQNIEFSFQCFVVLTGWYMALPGNINKGVRRWINQYLRYSLTK